MKNKELTEKLELKFYDFILTEHSLFCPICCKTETVRHLDIFEAISYFYNAGWSINRNNKIKCPKCNKIKKDNYEK